MKYRIVQAVIVLLFTIILYSIAVEQHEEMIQTKEDTIDINDLKQALDNMQYKIEDLTKTEEYNNEYTGTIPPFTYTADIVEIDLENNSLYGITSNKDTYSGLMRYDFSNSDIDIQHINKYSTYNIKCKPLIRDKQDGKDIVPYVEVISIEEASIADKQRLDESKYELSRYIEFKLKYELSTLEEIIEQANDEYYKWSDNDILDFQDWIFNMGYTDENSIVSNVKTIEQLKDEQ